MSRFNPTLSVLAGLTVPASARATDTVLHTVEGWLNRGLLVRTGTSAGRDGGRRPARPVE